MVAVSEPCVDAAPPPATFYTDNCTWFPDRPVWLPCCIEHDRAYWQGGSILDRLRADGRFAACVAARSEPVAAGLMFVGVRIIGMPWVPTVSRWGYGRRRAAGPSGRPCVAPVDARP